MLGVLPTALLPFGRLPKTGKKRAKKTGKDTDIDREDYAKQVDLCPIGNRRLRIKSGARNRLLYAHDVGRSNFSAGVCDFVFVFPNEINEIWGA